VPRWETVFEQVNHLGVEPGTQAYSARAFQVEWVPGVSWRSKQAYRVIHQPAVTHIHGLAVFAECLAVGLVCRGRRWLKGSSSTLETLAMMRYTNSCALLWLQCLLDANMVELLSASIELTELFWICKVTVKLRISECHISQLGEGQNPDIQASGYSLTTVIACACRHDWSYDCLCLLVSYRVQKPVLKKKTNPVGFLGFPVVLLGFLRVFYFNVQY